LYAWSVCCEHRVKKVVFVGASNSAFHEAVRETFCKVAESKAKGKVEVQLVMVPQIEDAIALSAICQKVLAAPADCILSVGRAISTTLVGLARKRGCKTPIVLVGVQNPVELGLIESLDRPGGNVTGVVTASFEDSVPARMLYAVLPSTKSVLLPFYFPVDAAREIESKAQGARNYLESVGVRATLLPLDSIPSSLSRIEGMLPGHDAILTVEGDGVNDVQYVGLAKLAERYGVAYFAGIMAAMKENVLGVYATDLRYIAEAGFTQVSRVLSRGREPLQLPVLSLGSTRELIINQKRAKELGVAFDVSDINAKIKADPLCSSVRARVRFV